MADETPQILKKVLTLEGKWESDATLKLGKDTFKLKYKFDFRKIADGQGLILDEGGDIPGFGTLVSTNIIGYDPYGGKLHWFTVDNFGTTHDHTGELVDENHLRIVHESQKEGKSYKEVADLMWISENELEVKLVGTLDGEMEEELQGTFKRA